MKHIKKKLRKRISWFQTCFIIGLILISNPLFIILWLYSDFDTAAETYAEIADVIATGMFEFEEVKLSTENSIEEPKQ